jgi:two-component system, OmpR family, alkaline phosphatase synthesis response regulator PhoP
MPGKKILLIEDEQDIVELVTYNLSREGFEVISSRSGEDGLKKAQTTKPDLILLDIMLPGINGLDICRTLKNDNKTSQTPIIMLTARNEDIDVVTGLEVGADDYVTKPFSPRILTARIRAMLRRSEDGDKKETALITFGEMAIDRGRHLVTIKDEPVQLTLTEFQLLLVLVRRRGWVFDRSQLIDELRDGHHVITDRAIDVQVANLRKKLGEYGKYIETVRGIGYRMQETP